MSFATNSVTRGQHIRGGMSSAVIYLANTQLAVLAHQQQSCPPGKDKLSSRP